MSFRTSISQVTDQASHGRVRNLRTSHLASSEFNSKDRPDGTSGPGTLALAGVPLAETVKRSPEKDQDEERGRRTSLMPV